MSPAPGPPDWPSAPPTADAPTTLLPGGIATPPTVARPARVEPIPPPLSAAPGSSARDVAGAALVVAGALLVALANIVAWANAVARDEASYEDARVLDLGDGSLERMIRDRLTTAVFDWADLEQRIDELLPGPLGVLGGPTEDLARTALDETVTAVLEQEPLAGQIDRIEQAADAELVRLLIADSDWFRLDGTALVLDLDPLVHAAAQRFDELVPDVLSEALPGISSASLLPDDIEEGGAEMTVGEVPVLAEATHELSDLERTALPLAVAGAGALVLGLVVSAHRSRTSLIAGVALAGAALALGMATWAAGAPPAPSTDALRAIAGHSLVDLDANGLLVRSAALFAAGLVAAGLVLLVTRRSPRPAPT